MILDHVGTHRVIQRFIDAIAANVAEEGNLYKQGLDIDVNSLESFNVMVV